MTGMDALRSALLALGLPVCPLVYPVESPDDVLPDDYIVLTPVYAAPDLYAGDRDEYATEQIRASWYSRGGNTGHARQMRSLGRDAGFMVLADAAGYDSETQHYIAHQEFLWDREDD